MTRSLTRQQVTEGHVPSTPAFSRVIIALEDGPKALNYLCLRLSKTSDTFSTLSPAEPFTPPTRGFHVRTTKSCSATIWGTGVSNSGSRGR